MRKCTAGLIIASTILTGCEIAEAQSDTMALLRAGSPQVCAAADVEQTLRNMTLPKVADFNDELSEEERQSLIDQLNVSMKYTRLVSFNEQVQTATCETNLSVNDSEWDIEFEISPASQNEGSFIIAAKGLQFVSNRATGLVAAGVSQILARQEREMAQEAEAAAYKLARETMSEEWLVGRWIEDDKSASVCVNGPFLEYEASGRYNEPMSSGTWKLDADRIVVEITDGSTYSQNYQATITAADADSFTQEKESGSAISLRRCQPNEGIAEAASEGPTATEMDF